MNERVKEYYEKAKAQVTKLSKKVRLIIVIAVVAVIIVAVVYALIARARPYAVLFTGLSSEEARNIVTYLDDNGISNYRLENGDTIKVPASQEQTLKAQLLMEGYPTSGFAYETYNAAVGTMSTESDRNIAYLHDLQDRMAGVIRNMDGVKDAVVTIAQSEDRRYILDSSNLTEASASVLVTMQGNQTLTSQQATAIRNLVSRAVQGLTIDNIAISDTRGNIYTIEGNTSSSEDASYLKLQLENQINNSVRTQIMAVLTPIFGEENVMVGVNTTVDVRHSVGESVSYAEPSWAAEGQTGGQGIIGSMIYDYEVIREGDVGNAGGVPGTETNADINTYVNNTTELGGDESYVRSNGEINYNVDTEMEQVERYAATVTDLMVSVTINRDTAAGVNVNDLLSHVARAAGIAPEDEAAKISILTAPFFTDDSPPTGILPDTSNLPAWALYAGIGGLGLLLILLVLLSFTRRNKRKKAEKELGALLNQNAMAFQGAGGSMGGGADIMTIKTEKGMELRKDIRQFADENPEIAASMIKTWLRGGDV